VADNDDDDDDVIELITQRMAARLLSPDCFIWKYQRSTFASVSDIALDYDTVKI